MAGKELSAEQVRNEVTDRIVKALEAGTIPWHKPWKMAGGFGGMPENPVTGRPYNGGLNVLLLWFSGFSDPRWMGFGQAKKKGWKVRKGQRSTVIYAPIFGYGTNDDGEKYKYVRAFRLVRVFNAEQMDGPPALVREDESEDTVTDPEASYNEVMGLLSNLGLSSVTHGGSRACYSPVEDGISMPKRESFKSDAAYLSTLLHEMVHSTGHKSRLHRDHFGKGISVYAFEELVAEIGSAFLCGFLGVTRPEVTTNHESYIGHWITRCKDDSEAFIRAAAMAWKACQYIRGESRE